MYGDTTTRMIAMYMEEAPAPLFLSGFFRSPPENFHETEKVTIDVERDDEEIAIVITDLSTGARNNESSVYTNKGFTPPVLDEGGTITAYDMIKRQPGQNPFQDPNFVANAMDQAFGLFRKLDRKIRRTVELMASQVLQTGVVTLRDSAGNALYDLDFQAKATHIVDASADWGGGSDNPIADIRALANVIRRDGKHPPDQLLFGENAWQNFIMNADVQKLLDKQVLNLGALAPVVRGQGATFQGFITIGHYRYEMWTYDGYYKDPQTGNPTSYLHPDKVIIRASKGRLDLTFGAIPMWVGPQQGGPLVSVLPPRMNDSERGLDLTTNAYITQDRKHLKIEAGTRPLTIPTAIDTFGCLNTQVP